MNVLIAGGLGYVGSALVEELLLREHKVRVSDRMFFGEVRLSGVPDNVELEVEDVRRISASRLEGIDAVVNLAGISSDPTAEYRPELTYDMNVVGAINLASACKEAGVRRYVFASSCSVYDSDKTADADDILLNEESPVDPASAYARSKLEAEKQLLALEDESFRPVILRKGTVFGASARMRFDLVANTLLKDALSKECMTIYAGGEMWRPVVDVSDAGKAYVACIEADESIVGGQVFNLVYANLRISEIALRIREALRQIGITTDLRAEYTQKAVRSYRASGEKIERVLGFKPTVRVEESVKKAVEQFRQLGLTDFDCPGFYNMRWFDHLEEEHRTREASGSVFD